MHSLSSLQLDAFSAVARTLNFSQAARQLHLTQSALSQRVLNLERELGVTLFIRDRAGIRLTETGESLLRLCQSRMALEGEFLAHVKAGGDASRLGGELRIGGFSSVMRSLVLPALAPLLREHPAVRLEVITRELRHLPESLRRGEIDFMILDHRLERDGIEAHELGRERNVLVRPARGKAPEIYLDHDEEDEVTRNYLKQAGRKTAALKRRFLDDVYGLIDGVAKGLGQAVLPRHLISGRKDLRVISPGTELEIPILLHYYAQPYYSRLHSEAVKALRDEVPKLLRQG